MHILESAWIWLVGVLMTVLGWIGVTQVGRVNNHAKRIAALEQENAGQSSDIKHLMNDVAEVKTDVKSVLNKLP